MSGVIAIIGRPNVGKSTLFNRLVSARQAIVDDQPGVTRDRHYGDGFWGDRNFTVIDTGGYLNSDEDPFAPAIREHVRIALAEADVTFFMVDVGEGLTPADEDLADLIRRHATKPVCLVINKADSYKRRLALGEFYALGFDDVFDIAAVSGSGTGELLDWAVANLPPELPEPQDAAPDDLPRIAILGRPNVGKSSLLNALMGQPRSVVTDVAGTTRDSLGARYTAFGFDYWLVDTAGLRKRTKVQDPVEFYATLRTIRALDYADIALLLLDATRGVEAQDLHILNLASQRKKGLVIFVNKWDAVDASQGADQRFRDQLLERIAPLSDVPIILGSALHKRNIHKAMQAVAEVHKALQRRIPTHELNEVMLPVLKATPPPAVRGKLLQIKFLTQTGARTPTFVAFARHANLIKSPYKRFMENRLRERFPFTGAPITIHVRESA